MHWQLYRRMHRVLRLRIRMRFRVLGMWKWLRYWMYGLRIRLRHRVLQLWKCLRDKLHVWMPGLQRRLRYRMHRLFRVLSRMQPCMLNSLCIVNVVEGGCCDF